MNIYYKVDPLIDYSKIKLVIFDVDGTLYNQKKMRIYMFIEIVLFLIMNPRKYNEIKVLKEFREQREIQSNKNITNLKNSQYEWAAQKLKVEPLYVKKIVDEWIFKRPLKYLVKCRCDGVRMLFQKLKNQGIKIAIYSDYPSKKKIQVLGLSADLIVSSIDKNIDRFKPDPKAVLYILKKLRVNKPENCLFVGDRYDKDQACAENASVASLIIK